MEPQHLERVAQKYRQVGYQVIIRPQGKELPSFASAFEPDLIATKGDEKVLVKVKRDRSDLSRDSSLSRLAEITNAQPEWRFDLVVLEPETPLEEAAAQASEPSIKQIEQLLSRAEDSAKAGDLLGSFVISWSGLEAAMRSQWRWAGLGETKAIAPTVLIRALYSSGLLSPNELRQLDRTATTRNQIVHGFLPPKVKPIDVRFLVNLARRLLGSNGKSDGKVKVK